MKQLTIGITAHVDSGKTTLAESMLYLTGSILKTGRVDHGDAFLDNDRIEKDRGITIFSHQAEFETGDTSVCLLDTPGHVDFSAETERTMRALDYAILVISGTDGVQSHTSTLWELLRRYEVPVFIFVSKMDITTADSSFILSGLQRELSADCVDFTQPDSALAESCAACCEELMDSYISSGTLTDTAISGAISDRRIFPVFFGSALKNEGVKKLLAAIDRYASEPERPQSFGAVVYKISYDSKGTRLTHMKITGGELGVRQELTYTDQDGNTLTERITSVRFYSGEKFRTDKLASAGQACTVTGLTATYAGLGLGDVRNTDRAYLEPVMTYRVLLPEDISPYNAIKDLRRLEDEDPQLHILWNEAVREIHIQLMGMVQLEVLTQRISGLFGYEVTFSEGTPAYRETIRTLSEGVGHYEPLRHYAEVHLLLEPLERGQGIQIASTCREDDLDRNWQRLIMTNIGERQHIGVLTGSPITDIRITLASGRAHLKHTEGGDFRQAVYRAVRHGLRSAESVLLEPYCDYELTVPSGSVGRAIADLQHMSADFSAPETDGEMSRITGAAPVSELNGYLSAVTEYTHGKGRLTCIPCGYRECHNAEEVIRAFGYDCDSDIENTADSVFCSHGAGYTVKWSEVREHMHLPSCLEERRDTEEEREQKARRYLSTAASDKELMEIFERTYGKINRDPRKMFHREREKPDYSKPVKLPEYDGPDYLLVDGYNVIFAWDELKRLAEVNLDDARQELINIMCNYQGYDGSEVIIVFDAYKVPGKDREIEKRYNISVVYTKEAETADSYIERVSHELTKKHRVRVATSDGAEQMIILGSGALRISASELHQRVKDAEQAIRSLIDGGDI
ncbi:MAG: TetM/TetW/TetO/TetS family tetracycline resistance ribosomal protection protein [Ruminococcus sp.]|nr:TetM/TetW/TetO/TetS family tetracycline resistance ribosomal protection protein [Ruminococcus sp.]